MENSGSPRILDRETTVRLIAHKLWTEEGKPDGRDKEHWQEAERQVNATPLDKEVPASLINCPAWSAIELAIRDCLNAHGKIDKNLLTSVTKRIYYALHNDIEPLRGSRPMLNSFSSMIRMSNRFTPSLEFRKQDLWSVEQLDRKLRNQKKQLKVLEASNSDNVRRRKIAIARVGVLEKALKDKEAQLKMVNDKLDMSEQILKGKRTIATHFTFQQDDFERVVRGVLGKDNPHTQVITQICHEFAKTDDGKLSVVMLDHVLCSIRTARPEFHDSVEAILNFDADPSELPMTAVACIPTDEEEQRRLEPVFDKNIAALFELSHEAETVSAEDFAKKHEGQIVEDTTHKTVRMGGVEYFWRKKDGQYDGWTNSLVRKTLVESE